MKNSQEISQHLDDIQDVNVQNQNGTPGGGYNSATVKRKKQEKVTRKFHSFMRRSFREKFQPKARLLNEEVGIQDIDMYKLIDHYKKSNPDHDESLNYLINKLLVLENTLTYLKRKLQSLEDEQY